ncbi:hypothetical protein CLOM_g16144 [Closterium sp. NIES-68]|nr:hypothetical protein CLOM_g23712 [Closterium sp. NIES-68]GJP57102.1 hypothetical protein CLOM_g16144 [Closterium sp. NIES-68]GJP66457.1 hypothetical protein CLOP_g23388 [Closterium sp. NIES-67]
MGKKKSSRSSARGGDDADDDDTASSASSACDLPAVHTGARDDVYCAASATEALLDALQEKRSTTREAALKGLMTTLASQVHVDLVQDKYDTLTQGFLACLRKGKAPEQVLAARCLGLLALTLGASDSCEELLASSLPHLGKLARAAGCAATRVACTDAIGMITFVGAMDAHATEESMSLLWLVANPQGTTKATVPAAVKGAAISNWTLLLSTLPSSLLAQFYARSELEALSRCLQDADMAVRGAAGEAIALVHEHCPPETLAAAAAAAGADDAGTGAGSGGGSANGSTNGVGNGVVESSDSDDSIVDGVVIPDKTVGGRHLGTGAVHKAVQQMQQMTVGSSKQMTKKDRLSQRLAFREILGSIRDNGRCSETVIRLKHGDSLRVDTWTLTVQLNALRKFLADGFQRHLQDNDLLHQVFSYQPRTEKKEVFQTAVQKRMILSPNSEASRNRSVARRRSRLAAQESNHAFFAHDD